MHVHLVGILTNLVAHEVSCYKSIAWWRRADPLAWNNRDLGSASRLCCSQTSTSMPLQSLVLLVASKSTISFLLPIVHLA